MSGRVLLAEARVLILRTALKELIDSDWMVDRSALWGGEQWPDAMARARNALRKCRETREEMRERKEAHQEEKQGKAQGPASPVGVGPLRLQPEHQSQPSTGGDAEAASGEPSVGAPGARGGDERKLLGLVLAVLLPCLSASGGEQPVVFGVTAPLALAGAGLPAPSPEGDRRLVAQGSEPASVDDVLPRFVFADDEPNVSLWDAALAGQREQHLGVVVAECRLLPQARFGLLAQSPRCGLHGQNIAQALALCQGEIGHVCRFLVSR